MTEEIVTYQSESAGIIMPVYDAALYKSRRELLRAFVDNEMVAGVDYGTIPGVKGLQLFLMGARKLCTLFRVVPTYRVSQSILDFDGTHEGNGEPLLYYRVLCELYRDGVLLSTCEASCGSREKKYRYASGQRKCPTCGQAAIIKGKAEYEGGWVCFKKVGGCGARYPDGDTRIESQQVGRIPNPDIADSDNTLLKMAQKRALLGAVPLLGSVADFFAAASEDEPTDYGSAPAQQRKIASNGAKAINNSGAPCPACHAPAGKPHTSACTVAAETTGE